MVTHVVTQRTRWSLARVRWRAIACVAVVTGTRVAMELLGKAGGGQLVGRTFRYAGARLTV